MTDCRWSSSSPNWGTYGISACITGWVGRPSKACVTCARHQASLVRAMAGSLTSSTTSSTSRQKA
ncbi:hypothetical protein HK414_11115 [Ramlibacter terrae]|uniref:Uncharacterized protein n=1 Tax=Ramlibacter terrae TaxID=2732511 RepID=A0ABX6NZE7_9BURK|nr:hypothetical protein HK414_11115 [Ramlibacter terrae]